MHRGIGLLGLGHLQKIIPGHFCCTERGQMPGGLLAVDLHHACTAAQGHQGCQGDFGGIALEGEHGFTIHRPAQGDAVQTADQFPANPGFHAVRQALGVQVAIGIDDAGHDPGAVLPWAWGGGAVLHDLPKAEIDANAAAWVALKIFQRLAQ